MMNEKYNAPNSQCCGRPMYYSTEPECPPRHCFPSGYTHKIGACIRRKQPDCTAQAVIPAITIEAVDGLSNYRNTFVHVTSINTTFYVDDKGTPIITWKGNVEVQLPENVNTQEEWEEFIKTFRLKGQFLYIKFHDMEDNERIDSFYFSNSGKIYFAGEFEDIGIGE